MNIFIDRVMCREIKFNDEISGEYPGRNVIL